MAEENRKQGRRRASPEQTRRKIIDATLSIAAEKGFEQTTTAEIARRAGVSEGSIYNHFRTKDDLLIHMVTEYAGSFLLGLVGEIGGEMDPLTRMEKLIAFHIRFFSQEGNIFQVLFGKTHGTKLQMARIIENAIGPYLGLLEEIVREGISQGDFKEIEPQIAASILLGGMQLTLLRRFFNLADYSIDEAIEQVKRIYLHGIMAQ